MKKILLLTLMIVLLIIVGCHDGHEEDAAQAEAPQQAAPTTDTQEAPTQEVDVKKPEAQPEPVAETTPEPEPVEQPAAEPQPLPTPVPTEEPAPTTPAEEQPPAEEPRLIPQTGYTDDVQKIVNKQQKVKSHSFYYSTSENWNLVRDQYFVKGNRIKIKLYEVNQWDKDYFDTVYLNTDTKEAEAFCEDTDKARCRDNDRKFDISYDDFIMKTPLTWLNEMATSAKVISSESFDERQSYVLEYPGVDGATVRIWIDKFSGVPVKVLVYVGELENQAELHGFKDLSINSVTNAEMSHVYDPFSSP